MKAPGVLSRRFRLALGASLPGGFCPQQQGVNNPAATLLPDNLRAGLRKSRERQENARIKTGPLGRSVMMGSGSTAASDSSSKR